MYLALSLSVCLSLFLSPPFSYSLLSLTYSLSYKHVNVTSTCKRPTNQSTIRAGLSALLRILTHSHTHAYIRMDLSLSHSLTHTNILNIHTYVSLPHTHITHENTVERAHRPRLHKRGNLYKIVNQHPLSHKHTHIYISLTRTHK